MSLPRSVQEELVHALPGLEQARLLRAGYAIEYDFVQPTELRPTLETHRVQGLFFAGQLNGTSGYEEAAAQGLVAGINAAGQVRGAAPFTLARDEAYVGVLVDDLVTRGCLEPYRIFTSRAEHRLLLRIDNADLRLTPKGRAIGLIGDEDWAVFEARRQRYERNRAALGRTLVATPGRPRVSAADLLRQPEVRLERLVAEGRVLLDLSDRSSELDLMSVETEVKYEGYLNQELARIAKVRRQGARKIPPAFPFHTVPGLSTEAVQRLSQIRPETLDRAARIPGVTPAAVAVLGAFLGRLAPATALPLP
jgi:tRNA uridine 5-carboxymethylaminomethyl modification enzyme